MKARAFEIIPAIDLIQGEAVRLTKGDFNEKTVYSSDPLQLAQRFEDAGIRRLHLVDLDGAKAGSLKNLAVLEKIAGQTRLQIDFGGGIGTRAELLAVFQAGAKMAAMGSIAVKAPDQFKEWVEEFGAERIFLGADVRNGFISVKGWTEDTALKLKPFLSSMVELDIQNIFCTDIQQDGMLQGPSVALYKQILLEYPDLNLVASGGVSRVEDLFELQAAGCSGAIVGKAIYENRISLEQLSRFLN